MKFQNRNTFCVETKGVCFFCLNENAHYCKPLNEEEAHDKLKSSNAISLKRLSKYLGIDFQNVFKLNIPLQYKNMGCSDVIAPLCAKCSSLVRKFSKLHQEFEVIKMHMHTCVQLIEQKMMTADNDKYLTSRCRKKWALNNPIDAIQAEIVDNFRRETKEKCALKVSRVFPKVKLEKLSVENTKNIPNKTSGEYILSMKRASEPANQIKENGSVQNLSAKIFKKATINENIAFTLPQSSMKTHDLNVKSTQPPALPVAANPVLKTQICRSEANQPKNTVTNHFYNKTTTKESSTDFSKSTSPSMNTQPQQFLPQLHQTTNNFAPTCSTASAPSSSNNSALAGESNQERPCKSIEKCPRRQSPPAHVHEYDCVHCDESFSDKSTLRIHVVRSHCEQFFTTLKDRSLSSDEFKSIVYLLFKDVANSHTVNQGSLCSKTAYSCPHCNITHESDGDVYAHMFRFHYTALTSRLLTLQKEAISERGSTSVDFNKRNEIRNNIDSLFLCGCGMRYASKRTLNFHQKYNCKYKNKINAEVTSSTCTVSVPSVNPSTSAVFQAPPRVMPSSNFKCAHCSKAFQFYYDHRVHLLTNHRIEEFSKYVSPGVTSEQVDSELKRMLQTYRKLPGDDNLGGCLFCSEIFSQVQELQQHILVGHFDVVVFKLRGILPQHSMCLNNERDISAGGATSHITNQVPNANHLIIPTSSESSNIPQMKPDTVEIIMEDPFPLGLIELDSNTDTVVCPEEEQLKMEWLFSFIDDDGVEIQSQPEETIIGEEKLIFQNNDSELILP